MVKLKNTVGNSRTTKKLLTVIHRQIGRLAMASKFGNLYKWRFIHSSIHLLTHSITLNYLTL